MFYGFLNMRRGFPKSEGGLASCSPWSREELDITGQLNNNKSEDIAAVSWLILFVVVVVKKQYFQDSQVKGCHYSCEMHCQLIPSLYCPSSLPPSGTVPSFK